MSVIPKQTTLLQDVVYGRMEFRGLIKYIQSDRQSGVKIRSIRDAIDSYIHAWYEDIEVDYLMRYLRHKYDIVYLLSHEVFSGSTFC